MEPISAFSQWRFYFEAPLFHLNQEVFQDGCNLWCMTSRKAWRHCYQATTRMKGFFSWLSHTLSKGFCFSMATFHGRSVWPLRIPSRKTKLLSQYLAWKFTNKYVIIPWAHWVTFIVSLPTHSNIMVTNSIYHEQFLEKNSKGRT